MISYYKWLSCLEGQSPQYSKGVTIDPQCYNFQILQEKRLKAQKNTQLIQISVEEKKCSGANRENFPSCQCKTGYRENELYQCEVCADCPSEVGDNNNQNVVKYSAKTIMLAIGSILSMMISLVISVILVKSIVKFVHFARSEKDKKIKQKSQKASSSNCSVIVNQDDQQQQIGTEFHAKKRQDTAGNGIHFANTESSQFQFKHQIPLSSQSPQIQTPFQVISTDQSKCYGLQSALTKEETAFIMNTTTSQQQFSSCKIANNKSQQQQIEFNNLNSTMESSNQPAKTLMTISSSSGQGLERNQQITSLQLLTEQELCKSDSLSKQNNQQLQEDLNAKQEKNHGQRVRNLLRKHHSLQSIQLNSESQITRNRQLLTYKGFSSLQKQQQQKQEFQCTEEEQQNIENQKKKNNFLKNNDNNNYIVEIKEDPDEFNVQNDFQQDAKLRKRILRKVHSRNQAMEGLNEQHENSIIEECSDEAPKSIYGQVKGNEDISDSSIQLEESQIIENNGSQFIDFENEIQQHEGEEEEEEKEKDKNGSYEIDLIKQSQQTVDDTENVFDKKMKQLCVQMKMKQENLFEIQNVILLNNNDNLGKEQENLQETKPNSSNINSNSDKNCENLKQLNCKNNIEIVIDHSYSKDTQSTNQNTTLLDISSLQKSDNLLTKSCNQKGQINDQNRTELQNNQLQKSTNGRQINSLRKIEIQEIEEPKNKGDLHINLINFDQLSDEEEEKGQKDRFSFQNSIKSKKISPMCYNFRQSEQEKKQQKAFRTVSGSSTNNKNIKETDTYSHQKKISQEPQKQVSRFSQYLQSHSTVTVALNNNKSNSNNNTPSEHIRIKNIMGLNLSTPAHKQKQFLNNKNQKQFVLTPSSHRVSEVNSQRIKINAQSVYTPKLNHREYTQTPEFSFDLREKINQKIQRLNKQEED